MQTAAGLPQEAKSLLASQRKLLESQREMAEEVLGIAAEADQLVGLLDGQLGVAAEWIDLTIPDSPALLQFGTLDLAKEETSAQGQSEPENSPDAELPSVKDDVSN